MEYQKIDSIEFEGIDYKDAPDFCDAFISYAELDGLEMTDEQLEEINEDGDFVHEQVFDYIH